MSRNAIAGRETSDVWPLSSRHLAEPDWAVDPGLVRILDAIGASGSQVRFVGGCVRDAALRRPPVDIDLATPAAPDMVVRLLEAAGIGAIPTGIDHGTVTAVADGMSVEVTTLRRDMETDGRRAIVAFTDDWKEDATRRDFTINALSMDRDARLYDPFDGLEDLAMGRVRFIGDADVRIREDYLRILRFFRFHAHYGWIGGEMQPLDPHSLSACARQVEGIGALSAERIWSELKKLLRAAEPAGMFRAMAKIGVLEAALPQVEDPDSGCARLASLVTLEAIATGGDSTRRLAALLDLGPGDGSARAAAAADRLRLSTRERNRLAGIAAAGDRISPGLPERSWRASLYGLGLERFQDLALLAWAEELGGDNSVDRFETEGWCALFRDAGGWAIPSFPLRGADLIALGLRPGPSIGQTLRTVEQWWIDGGFVANKSACLERARRIVA